MDAMKREHDFGKAAALFRESLIVNPEHEDSHYYLVNCIVALGDIRSAITDSTCSSESTVRTIEHSKERESYLPRQLPREVNLRKRGKCSTSMPQFT